MSMKEVDPVSGTELTEHEWDGIRELNTPVPWGAVWALRISIAISVVFWVFYPAFPYVSDFTRGVLGYSSREEVLDAVREADAQRANSFAVFETMDVAELAANPELEAQFSAPISTLYEDNCAACHRADLTGQVGFPNLTDQHWLWSGDPEEIEYTIRHGINAQDDDTRFSQMLAFGRDGMLDRAQISDVTEFVLSLSGQDHSAEAAMRGAEIFAADCASCHGDNGRGGLNIGAPDLGDNQWIYGGERSDITQSIYGGRQGVMPSWIGRLSESEIRMLTLYVLWASDEANQ